MKIIEDADEKLIPHLLEAVARIDSRLTTIERCVKEIQAAQKDGPLVKAQKEHISDLKKALDAVTDMAATLKATGAVTWSGSSS